MHWDFLRRQPDGAQGLYDFQSQSLAGWLAVTKGTSPAQYSVELEINPKDAEDEGIEFERQGILQGAVLNAV